MTISPFLKRKNNRTIGHHGREAEAKMSKRMGGDLTPASGAMMGAKGDVKVASERMDLLMENKATNRGSLSIKKEWLLKIYQEALEQGKVPALAIQFTNDTGNSEKRERWVAIPEHFMMELLGED